MTMCFTSRRLQRGISGGSESESPSNPGGTCPQAKGVLSVHVQEGRSTCLSDFTVHDSPHRDDLNRLTRLPLQYQGLRLHNDLVSCQCIGDCQWWYEWRSNAVKFSALSLSNSHLPEHLSFALFLFATALKLHRFNGIPMTISSIASPEVQHQDPLTSSEGLAFSLSWPRSPPTCANESQAEHQIAIQNEFVTTTTHPHRNAVRDTQQDFRVSYSD